MSLAMEACRLCHPRLGPSCWPSELHEQTPMRRFKKKLGMVRNHTLQLCIGRGYGSGERARQRIRPAATSRATSSSAAAAVAPRARCSDAPKRTPRKSTMCADHRAKTTIGTVKRGADRGGEACVQLPRQGGKLQDSDELGSESARPADRSGGKRELVWRARERAAGHGQNPSIVRVHADRLLPMRYASATDHRRGH